MIRDSLQRDLLRVGRLSASTLFRSPPRPRLAKVSVTSLDVLLYLGAPNEPSKSAQNLPWLRGNRVGNLEVMLRLDANALTDRFKKLVVGIALPEPTVISGNP